jgi:short-subunit dehydrogenase
MLRGLLFAAAAVLVALAALRLRRSRRFRSIPKGSVALVTGGSSGIGEELALQLARRGCRLILVARTLSKLDEVAKKCSAAGAASVKVLPADLSQDASIVSLASAVRAYLADISATHINLLVLNAGRGAITAFDDSQASYDIAKEMIDINYLSNVRLLQLLLPVLQPLSGSAGKWNRVLVVSSLAGVLPSALRAAYTGSKHALQGFCNALRQEYGSKGIHFTLACPSFVQTEFHAKVASSSGEAPKRAGAHHFMTAERCASLCLDAVEHDDMELIMTTSAKFGYKARPFLPALVDSIARKKALGNVILKNKDQ